MVKKYSVPRGGPRNTLFRVLMWGTVESKRLSSLWLSSRNIPKGLTWEYTISSTYVRGSWGIQGPCVDLYSSWLVENLLLTHICLKDLQCRSIAMLVKRAWASCLILCEHSYCHIFLSAPCLFFFSSFSGLPLASLWEAVWEAVKFSLKDSRVLIPICKWEGIQKQLGCSSAALPP